MGGVASFTCLPKCFPERDGFVRRQGATVLCPLRQGEVEGRSIHISLKEGQAMKVLLKKQRVQKAFLVGVVLALLIFIGIKPPRLYAKQEANTNCTPEDQRTLVFAEVFGFITPAGSAPVGSTITAHRPDGVQVGCVIIDRADQYGLMRIYGKDEYSPDATNVLQDGDSVTFRINGVPVDAHPKAWDSVPAWDLVWQKARDDKKIYQVDLEAQPTPTDTPTPVPTPTDTPTPVPTPTDTPTPVPTPTDTPTPVPTPTDTPTPVPTPTDTPTPVPTPTDTPTPVPTPTDTPTPVPTPTDTPTPTPTPTDTPTPTPTPTHTIPTPTPKYTPTPTPTPCWRAIYGVVFHDKNGNGLRDKDEDGIPHVLVHLEGPLNRMLHARDDGTYAFVGLPAGEYRVWVEKPAMDWLLSTPEEYNISVPGFRCFASYHNNFGFYKQHEVTPTPTVSPEPTPTPIPPGYVEHCEVSQIIFMWDDAIDVNGRNAYLSSALRMRQDRPVGLRFIGLTVPKGVTVTHASLTVVPYWWRDVKMEVEIHGDMEMPSQPFFTWTKSAGQRDKTDAYALWTINERWYPRVPVSVDGLENVIQEIVDSDTWVPGMPLSLILQPREHTPGKDRIFYAVEGNKKFAPKLRVCYLLEEK